MLQLITRLEVENRMKEVLENLSIALGYKGEINKATQEAAENMLAFGMTVTEINIHALACIESENFGKS